MHLTIRFSGSVDCSYLAMNRALMFCAGELLGSIKTVPREGLTQIKRQPDQGSSHAQAERSSIAPRSNPSKEAVDLRVSDGDVGELTDGERRFEEDAAVDHLIVMAVPRWFAGVG